MTCWEKAIELVIWRVCHFQSVLAVVVAVQFNFKKARICRLKTKPSQSSQFECRSESSFVQYTNDDGSHLVWFAVWACLSSIVWNKTTSFCGQGRGTRFLNSAR
jgi:hypothetical protein